MFGPVLQLIPENDGEYSLFAATEVPSSRYSAAEAQTGFPAGVREHAENDLNVPFVSGSARFDAMVIVPCSMATLGRIASGCSDTALLRAADVFLKERRKLILVPRETPWSLIHARNIVSVNGTPDPDAKHCETLPVSAWPVDFTHAFDGLASELDGVGDLARIDR